MFTLKKTAIVTGGSRGIGAAICEALYNEGYNVVICYNKNKEKADALSEKLAGSYTVYGDLREEQDAVNIVSETIKQFGKVDLLVNNAGIAMQKLFQDTTLDEWNNMISSNLTSAFLMSKAVLPNMISSKSGNIINISSMWGQVGGSCEVAYSASKAGIIGLTKALAKEVGPSGIRVNCIAPGVIETDMIGNLNDDDKEALKDETPLERLGMPADIANTVCFLASDKASFITGQILGVNGGIII